jgi:hypothetical protein
MRTNLSRHSPCWQRAWSHWVSAALALGVPVSAFASAFAVQACSAPATGPQFGDPPSDDAGNDSAASSTESGGGGGGHDASSSSGGMQVHPDSGGGVDAGPPASCKGTPSGCASVTAQSACMALGCMWGACVGSVLPCAGLNESRCTLQQNCTFSGGVCSGSAIACNLLAAAYGCTTQQGCTWQPGCLGSASVSCTSLRDSASCTSAGCSWN